jgi:hypothetical protein
VGNTRRQSFRMTVWLAFGRLWKGCFLKLHLGQAAPAALAEAGYGGWLKLAPISCGFLSLVQFWMFRKAKHSLVWFPFLLWLGHLLSHYLAFLGGLGSIE